MPREKGKKRATTNRQRGRPKPRQLPDPAVVVLKGEHKTFAEWEASLTPTENLVQEIAEYMANGAWLGGVSDKEVAKKHNLSPDTVRRYAAEANRLLRDRLREDPELRSDAKESILQSFRVIRALATKNGDAGSLGVALNATRALGFYLGLEPSRALEVTTPGHEDFNGWSTEEIEDYAASGKKPRRALRAVARHLLEQGSAPEPIETNGHGTDDDEDDLH